MTNTKVKVGEFFYTTFSRSFFCCDELQYSTQCEKHDEPMGCMFCEFDYSLDCEEQH